MEKNLTQNTVDYRKKETNVCNRMNNLSVADVVLKTKKKEEKRRRRLCSENVIINNFPFPLGLVLYL